MRGATRQPGDVEMQKSNPPQPVRFASSQKDTFKDDLKKKWLHFSAIRSWPAAGLPRVFEIRGPLFLRDLKNISFVFYSATREHTK